MTSIVILSLIAKGVAITCRMFSIAFGTEILLEATMWLIADAVIMMQILN